MNEPSRKLVREPTKQMDLDAVLSNNLSQINKLCSLITVTNRNL